VTSEPTGPELDARRARVVDADLTGAAVAALSPLVRTLPIEALTPVKQALKRYFSDQPWTDADDDALADLVGPAPTPDAPPDRVELAPGSVLVWSWPDGRFRLRVHDEAAPPDA
jgi:hypothetical protein